MRKIIVILRPFDLKQQISVYEDGNKLEVKEIEMSQVVNAIFELSNKYNINQIDLSGARHYAQKFIKDIESQELTKYNENKFEINII